MKYQRTHDGRVVVHDWPPIKAAITKAYDELGKDSGPNQITQDDWNLASIAIFEYQEALRCACFTCKRMLSRHEEIRCLDCKAVFCERCAAHHFWPHGRSKKE